MKAEKSRKVLVVEDEGLIAHDISSRLEAMGHQVVAIVGTGEEAVEKAGEADIVLMDIQLDGRVDGVEAAKEIRNRYHVPVVFLTAHADGATLDRAKVAEPFGYIVKPMAHAALNTSIEIAMYKHGMDRKLEERESCLSTTLASVADAVIVTGPDGRIRLLNRAAESLTGWPQAEAEGQLISKVVGLREGDFEGEVSDPVSLAILRDAPVALDRNWTLLARGGREMQIEGNAAPMKSGSGVIGAVLTLRDVSARRWEERQLRQALKLEAVSRLAAGVSHAYSELVGVIRLHTENLMRHFGDYSPAKKAAEEIQQASAAADQITRRLAEFSSRKVSQQEVLGLNGLLLRISKLLEAVAGPNITTNIRLSPVAGKIKADESQIEQAIMSVVLHACSTMTGGGRLLIETGTADIPVHGRLTPHVLFALIHTGNEPEPDKLFEPISTTDEGLSLSMVHAIVVEHGGFISAQPTAGGGCRYEMLLPQVSGRALVPRPDVGQAPSILLVEDRERVRLHLHNFFEANGYNLLEAADAGEALALGQVHEGALGLLIAEPTQAATIAGELRALHTSLAVLHIVDGPESALHEIRRPFNQQTLLLRVQAILGGVQPISSSVPASPPFFPVPEAKTDCPSDPD